MIPRYSRPEMAEIWTEESKFRSWLEVEIAVCEAWAELGVIPKEALEVIKKKARFEVARIEEIEAEVKHDVIAFLTNVAEYVGPEARYIHLGMTSSDVLDTAMALRMKRAMEMIIADVEELLEVIKQRALEHQDTVMIGRTHGIHAEPITFGLKLAIWYEEFRRHRRRLEAALETISYGKISGAVGTYAHLDPRVEELACKRLGLMPAPVSSQIIQRDRYAEYLAALALLAGTVEKVATEIRHLQRTEVLEAEEYFSPGQKGSSAMPHKRNPILSENLCGLARLVRGYLTPALENMVLWHERDISHSSVERVIVPDATIATDFMLRRLTGVLRRLVVYPERMKKNLWLLRGLIFSQQVMLKLTEKGLSREEAYGIVQKLAMEVWQNEDKNFKDLLLASEKIRKYLSPEEIESLFDVNHYLRHVKTIFNRVFGHETT
ncbi:adenylosuccinate lyase [Thermosulfuriphilus ammonigenes]|uniref:Adenylosuccinate lyase n=1 Tax=Thermosulfuriphilus ammonigenes TaxID=1936021 RepID=A0A6G7PWU4_9BACT|nr:adenylosuccinate lyase [Thermosulfuriphilus ammonigenes]MBA2847923.1 adenylosuccinate lyase [Thermosulfuriphilus ammonigenes]QIJ71883.1 adenylosuccinate lyase [Thermosulfuriphilus ammonigenes]